MQEMRRKQEEARQRELEEKRIKEEEAKRKRLEEAERKRQQMQEALKKQREAAKRSFAMNKKSDGGVVVADLANVASLGRSDIIKTKEQLAEEKKIAMQFRVKPLQVDGLGLEELKKKANDLWEQIVQAESDRYDLEERQKRQEYDLKELSERQRQINRNKALKKGLDPEALSGKHPPKLQVASKYERRLDRRDFGDKKGLFEGGWDKLTKEEQDKLWEERINSFKESHGDKRVNKWDPSTLRQALEESSRAIYEDGIDDDDMDMIDAYKSFIKKEDEQAAADRRRSSAASAQQSQPQSRRTSQMAPPPPQKEEEEEEEEEEEVEEEEEYEEEEEEEEEEE